MKEDRGGKGEEHQEDAGNKMFLKLSGSFLFFFNKSYPCAL